MGESSIQIGAVLRWPAARASREYSSPSSRPRLSRCASTRASAQRKRCTSCSFDISRLKMATGTSRSMATNCATLSTHDVLPIDGRPATIARSPAWSPVVILSRS